jgi:hypothetical protein
MASKEQVLNMSKEEFEAFLRAQAGEILNKATVFEEIADRVLGEEEEGQKEQELEKGSKGLEGMWRWSWGSGSGRQRRFRMLPRYRSGPVRGFKEPRMSTS